MRGVDGTDWPPGARRENLKNGPRRAARWTRSYLGTSSKPRLLKSWDERCSWLQAFHRGSHLQRKKNDREERTTRNLRTVSTTTSEVEGQNRKTTPQQAENRGKPPLQNKSSRLKGEGRRRHSTSRSPQRKGEGRAPRAGRSKLGRKENVEPGRQKDCEQWP